ncbi:uncharacterized protein LOC127119685 [Lathyrus oleraceus]|uniref:uncharacterized protein LOC127119685 n=1 Tax=Pisum sativum TaxID=3888 RepID=UPI0021CEFB17|nr:uncharacterized protein LOC127119685 [Pisum sativum]
MSATDKLFVKIFERKKQFIEQVRQESLLWEDNLRYLLILNGISPPPWLNNSAAHSSFPSDPKDLFKDDTVYQDQPSQAQFGVPSVGDIAVSTIIWMLYLTICVMKSMILKKDHDTGGRLSNFPDCSVSNVGCASSGPLELDSVVVSPQNQIEQRVSESFLDSAVSFSKLHRSRSRQKALEQCNSAKASKPLSVDGDNVGDCTAGAACSAPPSLQEDHIKELGLVNEFHPNNRSCLTEEMRKGGCLTRKDHSSNYTGRKTRSKSSSQKFNSLSIRSFSVEKEHGPPLNDLNEEMELISRPSFINGSCGVQEPNLIDFQNKDVGSSVYDKRLSIHRTSSQAEHSSELLNLDSSSGRYKVVEVSDINQPCSHVELKDVSKTSDCINGSRRNIVKDGDFCQTEQESNIQSRLRLHRSSCPSPGDDFFTTNGSGKSIDKSVQLPQPLILKNLQDPSVAVVGSLCSQEEPHISEVKTKEYLSKNGSGNIYLTRNSKLSKSPNSKSRGQRATHFTSPIRRYADVIVYRLLVASIGISKLPFVFQDRLQLTSIADNLNYRHRNAQMAGRASVELHTLIYFRKRPTDTEARIVKIRSNGFFVFVPKYGIEGPVYLTTRDEKGSGEWYVDEQEQKIKKMDGSSSYNILQTVQIHMEVVEPQPNRPKLQLTLI